MKRAKSICGISGHESFREIKAATILQRVCVVALTMGIWIVVVVMWGSVVWGQDKGKQDKGKQEKEQAHIKGYRASPLVGEALGGQGLAYGVPASSGGVLLKRPYQPTEVRVRVLGTRGSRERTLKLQLLLEREASVSLDKRVGMQVRVTGLSEGKLRHKKQLVRYRAGFLRAALLIAEAVQGEQLILRAAKDSLPKEVDILIELGDAS